MPKIFVVKASGETENFDPAKIRRTCLRAGASDDLADRVVKEVTRRVRQGMSTHEILEMIIELLGKEQPHIAARYDLKGAVMRLGPAGFAFEALLAEVLREYGYTAVVHNMVQGACVVHEIDVIATKPYEPRPGLKELKTYMVEAKYHHATGIYTGLKEALYTYARFLDLQEGNKLGKCQRFDQPWLATNTKFSPEALAYATCRGVMLLGWAYPVGNSLQDMLEAKQLYPITVLRTLDFDSQIKMATHKLMLIKDLIRVPTQKLQQITGLSDRKLRDMIAEAEMIMSRPPKNTSRKA
jgi:hypothetical protein